MARTIEQDRVGAVVVTHHPPAEFDAHVARVAAQVSTIVIVDNSSTAEVRVKLANLAARTNGHLIANPSNLGVARALNQGLGWLAEGGSAWALLLDQDSVVAFDMVHHFAAAYEAEPSDRKPALIAANFLDPQRDTIQDPVAHAGVAALRDVDTAITSGSLLSLDAWRAAGPFREEFFIDYVDLEYCFRLRRRGYRVSITRDILMAHSVGSFQVHRLLGFEARTSNHRAARYYFMVRNHLILLKELFAVYPRWSVVSLCERSFSLTCAVLLEQDRVNKLRYMLAGFVDGVRGSTRRNPLLRGEPSVPRRS